MKKIVLIFLLIILIQKNVNAKYFFEYIFDVADLNIDRTKPVIDVLYFFNTNIDYEKYANKTHEINVEIRVTEKNIGNDVLEKNEIEVMINNEKINNCKVNINEIARNNQEIIYDIKITNIEGNGNLTLNILEGAVIDTSGLKSESKIINTDIIIDNIAPKGNLTKEIISNGKVRVNIVMSEKIRNVKGWNLSEDDKILTNDFTNNIYYELDVIDFAQNVSKIQIDVSEATNIILSYASHNSEYGWSYGYSNYDIAGKNAVKIDPNLKTEALAFSIKGNVSKDFLQVKAYDYTYWGQGGIGTCGLSGKRYMHGYNPSQNTWESMNSNQLITLQGEKYFELGGAGVNLVGNTDINGNNPIPFDNRFEFRYGISGISMKLKDYSYYSVVYQIFIGSVGWIEPKSDGEECMYMQNKPFSAFRMALVPQKEKQYILDMWNKDIGTFNMDLK